MGCNFNSFWSGGCNNNINKVFNDGARFVIHEANQVANFAVNEWDRLDRVIRETFVKQLVQKLFNEVIGGLENELKRDLKFVTDSLNSYIRNVFSNLNGFFLKFFLNLTEFLTSIIVLPIVKLFKEGFFSIIQLIISVLTKIASKIVNLPTCFIVYVISNLNISSFFPDNVVSYFKWIVSSLYLDVLMNYFLKWIGYTDWANSCLEFNLEDDINHIAEMWHDVFDAFKQSFGNFTRIGCVINTNSDHPCRF